MKEGAQEHYIVLVNEEEQYSLWPAAKVLPAGWRLAGKEGSEQECMAFVDEVWTDMRPLSLRRSSHDRDVGTDA